MLIFNKLFLFSSISRTLEGTPAGGRSRASAARRGSYPPTAVEVRPETLVGWQVVGLAVWLLKQAGNERHGKRAGRRQCQVTVFSGHGHTPTTNTRPIIVGSDTGRVDGSAGSEAGHHVRLTGKMPASGGVWAAYRWESLGEGSFSLARRARRVEDRAR